MDPKTRDHLRAAARNRDLARALLAPGQAGLEPTPWEWVAVILFYSAVHYVNGYLWEQYHIEPRNHDERTRGVNGDPVFVRCRRSYGVLKDVGFRARYDERYVVSEQTAGTLLHVDLRAVEAAVMQALGEQVPAW